jgi:hypothetical protein
MNQQPDKLFRDKLQSYSTPAPSGAWNRIEANLEKKNDKILWFRIAASLLLVAIAAWLLWPSNKISTPQPLSDKTKKQEIVTPEKKKEKQVVAPTPIQENIIAKKEVNAPTPIKKKQLGKTEVEVRKIEAVANETSIAQNVNTSVESSEAENTHAISTPAETQNAVVASAATQKVKIIFSAEEVNNKYLDKNALAEATSDEKKSSTLKKLLDKAYDLKNNQDPFGDLRQKKNEILALNFRTDKQRKEN